MLNSDEYRFMTTLVSHALYNNNCAVAYELYAQKAREEDDCENARCLDNVALTYAHKREEDQTFLSYVCGEATRYVKNFLYDSYVEQDLVYKQECSIINFNENSVTKENLVKAFEKVKDLNVDFLFTLCHDLEVQEYA